MTIFAEIISDRLEVSYSELPQQRYLCDLRTLISEAASEPYRRGESSRWFAGGRRDQHLAIWNGRPC